MPIDSEIVSRVGVIVGLPLSALHHAADMAGFHFGRMRPVKNGSAGQYVVHVQCPWRIEYCDAIYTGTSDLYEPSSAFADDLEWERRMGHRQGEQMRRLLGCGEGASSMIVTSVFGDRFGGATVIFANGAKLVLFPDGSVAEDWRFFDSHGGPHFVVSGGKCEP